DLNLKDLQTVVALEMWGIHPPDVPFDKTGKGEGPMFFLNLLGLKGPAEVQRTRYRDESLPAPCLYQWNSRQGAPGGPRPLPSLPRWFTDLNPPTTPQARDMTVALNELGTRLATKSVEVALAETRKDKPPASRILAMRCLAATDAITTLMDILNDSSDAL